MKPLQFTLRLGERSISYQVKQSTRAKNVNIKVSEENGLEVVVPLAYPLGEVELLLRNRENWILEKLAVIERRSKQKKAIA